ncbi:MAG: N-acetylmuramoyl-L-alanine amidase [Elusimicrobiota bacterium]
MWLKNNGKFWSCFFILVFLSFSFVYSAIKQVTVIKERNVVANIPLFMIQGMGYLSCEDIARVYNAKINWYPVSKKIILTLNNKEISFKIDSKKVVVNNQERLMNKPARLQNKKLLIPLEFILTRVFTDVANSYTEWDYYRSILRITPIPDIFPTRYYSYKDKTRLVIQMVNKKEVRFDDISKEKKLTLKIYRSRLNPEKNSVVINDGVVNSIDATNLDRDAFFVVNLGNYSGKIETFTLYKPYRFVIDIERVGSMVIKLPGMISEFAQSSTSFAETNIPSAIIPPPSETKEAHKPRVIIPTTKEKIAKWRKRGTTVRKLNRIVVDAGHGGEDAGAIGPKGTKEKDINLSVALKLAKVLEDDGYAVYLTRHDDTFIPLADRAKFANKVLADLFVSIHCNASISEETRGFEIYFLSENATDRAAEAVANMENSVVVLEKGLSKDNKKDIEKLLLSMAVNEFMNESSAVCGFINQQVCKNFSNIESRGVKQANFFVLRGATMPAVLVELAFLSHSKEEKLLKQKKFQKRIVEAIYNGIKKYEKQITK